MITAVAYFDEAMTQYKVTTDNGMYSLNILPAGDPNRCYQHDEVDLFLQTHSVGAWVDPVDWMDRLRRERNQRLSVCDWTQVADSPLSAEQKTAYAVYRQALRDFPASNAITTQAEYVALTWPTME